MKKVFFSNSGAEANECAIKVARKYAQEKYGKDHFHIVTLVNSFHGRTLTTLAATGQEAFHKDFTPLTEGFLYVEANNISALEEAVNTHPCAGILMEVVQGEGGVIPLDPAFVKELDAYLKEQDILLMVDEVQTGNGRTGKLYSYMHYGISPDVVSTAKGLGGGLPIGACLMNEKTMNVLVPGDHGSTYGGNPVCCAGAVSVLERLDDAFLAEVEAKGAFLRKAFADAPGIEGVDGLGLMLGLRCAKPAGELVKKLNERGVLCLTAKTKIRLLPALNIPMELLEEAAEIIKSVCAEA
jgi:acetylornithine/N-succinyldiaminopimelate aminotransferase